MRRPYVLILLTATLFAIILANLHASWTVIPWLIGIGIWGAYFWSDRLPALQLLSKPIPFSFGLLALVLLAAAAVRLYRLADFPLGANVDEIFTLNDTLLLLEKPFDAFGQTPLISEGWVEIPNLYLCFNLLILKLVGVSYWSMKLLSVVPGVLACVGIFLIAHLVFERRIAFCTAILFAFAHWPVRLSRYGWIATFMTMTFAISIWLLLLGIQRGRRLYSYLAGVAAGVGLYSYLGARICLVSLLGFFVLDGLYRRDRSILKQAIALATGVATVGFPLFCYYLIKPKALWVRTDELSIFSSQDPLGTLVENIWRHALMFHATGGTFARDNFPGLPALDPLTGLLFILGLLVLIRLVPHNTFARLVTCTLILNFAGGVFSISQEGPPYLYRTAALMVPAFLIVGFGVEWLMSRARALTSIAVALALLLNVYFYFGLEAKNTAAMRVMSYELRQIGQEIAKDDLPVLLVGADVTSQSELHAKPDEKYAEANPAVVPPPVIRRLAIINFSGRYDITKPVSENLSHPKNIYFAESMASEINGPAKIIFKSRSPEIDQMLSHHRASVRELRNLFDEPFRTVAVFF